MGQACDVVPRVATPGRAPAAGDRVAWRAGVGCAKVPAPVEILESERPAEVFDALARRRLLIVSGKGGVGRTSVAALLGLALAARGKRTLVATTGHDDRLAWMLCGSDATLPDVPQEVAPNLHVQRLVPQVALREYGALVLKSQMLSSAVFDNRVVRRLLKSLPGLDDFTILGKVWHEAVRTKSFDVVIFDGPATGHLRLNLGVPRAILSTIPAGPLVSEARLMQQALEDDSQVTSVLVGLPESWPLTELGELGAALRREVGISVGALVVNGMLPEIDLDPSLVAAAGAHSESIAEAVRVAADVGARARRQRESLVRWLEGPAARSCAPERMMEVAWRGRGLVDPADMKGLHASLEAAPARAPGPAHEAGASSS